MPGYDPVTLPVFVPPDMSDVEPPRTEIHPDRPSWLRARHPVIGASDTAAILGLSRFRGPWPTWRDKVDKVVDAGWSNSMAEWGSRLEGPIADKFAEEMRGTEPLCSYMECDIVDLGDYTMVHADDCGVPLACTPDRLLELYGDWVAALEIKCAWLKAAKEWNERIPLGYQCQLQFTMFCCQVKTGFFAVLLDGHEFRWHRLDYNERFIRAALPKLARFWQHVQDGTPPAADFSESTAKAIAAHYAEPVDERVELPDDFGALDAEREKLSATISDAEKRKRYIDNQLKAALGNATMGVLPDHETAYTWRPTAKGHRTLRRTILKGGSNER